MLQEGAAKLRLKPKKAPPACSREPSPGRESLRRRQTLADRCFWFEKDDFNEYEKPWILLLKDITQDLQCTSWQTVPSFPEFFEKSSEEESLRKQEVFTTGMRDFQWVSFPSFCKEKCLNPKDLSSHQLTQSQIDNLHKGQGQAGKPKSLPSTTEKTCCVTTTDQAKDTVEEDTKGVSKLAASPKSCKLTQHRSSTHHMASSQSSVKAFGIQQHCRTVQNSRENQKENDRKELQMQIHKGNILFSEARYVPAEEKPPLVSAPGTESCKEKTENRSEGSSTLDSCPMCLIHFTGRLSQLDIDSHLARCLSESADDVTW